MLRQAVDMANVNAALSGDPLIDEQVVVAGPQTAPSDVLQAYGFANDERLARGLEPVKVFDLR
jgi:hypothetical protein